LMTSFSGLTQWILVRFKWDEYCAPDELKFELQNIANKMDPVFLQCFQILKNESVRWCWHRAAKRPCHSVPQPTKDWPNTGNENACIPIGTAAVGSPSKGIVGEELHGGDDVRPDLNGSGRLVWCVFFIFNECDIVFMKLAPILMSDT